MIIYIVQGGTGEHSDHENWLVKAFRDEKLAQQLVENADKRAIEIQLSCSEMGYYNSKIKNEFDPKMEMTYTGTYYNYYPIELVE